MLYLCAQLKPLLTEDRAILATRNVEIRGDQIMIPCSIKQGVDFGLVARFIVRNSEYFLIRERRTQETRGFKIGYFRLKRGKFIPIMFETQEDGFSDQAEMWAERALDAGDFYSVFVHANRQVEISSIRLHGESVIVRTIRPRGFLNLNDSEEMLYRFKRENLNLPPSIFPGLIRYICLLANDINANEEYIDDRREDFDSDGETPKLRVVS